MIISEEDAFVLAHYGVKGMRWGVRKRGGTVDVLAPTRSLSNDELRKVVDRMRLEQQYTELSNGRPAAKIVDGRKQVKKIMDKVGDKGAEAVATVAVAYAIGQFLKKKPSAAKYLTKDGGKSNDK